MGEDISDKTVALVEHPEGYCLWEDPSLELAVAVVGTGPGFMTVMDIIYDVEYRDYLPPMRLIAVADSLPNPSKHDWVRKKNIPIYGTHQEMLTTHPEINLLIELTAGRHTLATMRRDLPAHVSLIDHAAAIFLCGMHNMFQVSSRCHVSLERQRAMFEAVVDRIQEDILLIDRECRVVDLNRNMIQQSGRNKLELIGKYCWEVEEFMDGLPFCQGKDPKCPLFITLNTRQNAEALFTRVSPEGRMHYFRMYSYPMTDAVGELTHVLIMRRDITARTEREKKVQQAEKMAVIGEMAMYLAHEIRNPLVSMGGFANALLKTSNLSDKDKEKARIIAEEAKQLEGMLSRILEFTRPAKQAMETVEVNQVVQEIVELMRMGYGSQGYTFRVATTEDLPKIKEEFERVKQSLINLIKNAVEAMPTGGEIVVRTGLSDGLVTLSVEDHGVGMTESQAKQAFSPFFSTKTKGFGLGLAMIKKIVEESGGRVELSTQKNIGTTVTLSFPPILAEGEGGRIIADGADGGDGGISPSGPRA